MSAAPQEVAVIGMSARFPGAGSVETFWADVLDQRSSVDSDLGEVEMFDGEFFGIDDEQASLMDPQHRIFLEECWHAVEAAGYDPTTLPGHWGAFAGCAFPSYLMACLGQDPTLVERVGWHKLAMLNDRDSLVARLAHALDLKGPCLTVQSYSATGAAAVHLAYQALVNGECDFAIAGASSFRIPGTGRAPGIDSPTDRCLPLDARADGTVSRSGVGVLVLRPLETALASGDHVHAVLLGSALSNDGASRATFTTPGLGGKVAAIEEAWGVAGVGPDQIDYVEMASMGAPVADDLELWALARVLDGRSPERGPCLIGSAAGNVGHLDAAAGIAGLIRAILSVEHGTVPGQASFLHPSPAVSAHRQLFRVNARTVRWPSRPEDGHRPRRAGVTSLGIGGQNVHLVLQEPPGPDPVGRPAQGPDETTPALLTLAARDHAGLRRLAGVLRDHLLEDAGADVHDIAWTLQHGRSALPARTVCFARNRAEAVTALSAVVGGQHGGPTSGGSALGGKTVDVLDRWLAGQPVDWGVLHPAPRRRVPLPGYPFARHRHWLAAETGPDPALTRRGGIALSPRPTSTARSNS